MATLTQRVNPNVAVTKALGFNPRGVLVDNVTAYWLYFPQADQYCPPFTAGWSAAFTLNMAGYGYMEVKTPFGQNVQTNVTVNISQYVNLTWTDQQVPSYTGTSVDPGDVTTSSVSPLATAYFESTLPVSGPTIIPIIAANAVKRIRIHAFSVMKVYAGVGFATTLDATVYGGLTRSSTGDILYVINLDSNHQMESQNLVPGVDLDINEGLSADFQTFLCDAEVIGTVTYEYI